MILYCIIVVFSSNAKKKKEKSFTYVKLWSLLHSIPLVC